LFDAFEQLAAENADVSLVLVGAGALEREMRERRERSRAPERILIRQHVSQLELSRYYAVADVFCLPSLYDTFGVVIVEAMASGLPIVTTSHVGAVADLVRDGVNGRVVQPGDVTGLAQALAQLVSDDTLRKRMGECARERMKSWSVDTAAHALLKCIDMCC
jgi:glycosyltransferase involved in cell wall biosynthesis